MGIALEKYGWDGFFSGALSPEDKNLVPGRISSQHRSLYRVFTASGEIVAAVAGRMLNGSQTIADLPAVGDWVLLRMRESARARITKVLPRRSRLSRRSAGERTEEQIICANVDTVFIVTALDHDFSVRRIERYLSVTIDGGAAPVVILSKSDLAHEDVSEERRALTSAVALAAPVHVISTQSKQGLEALQQYLQPGKTVAFVGSSGVGKSTLINSFFGEDVQKTAAVRETDGTGRHTTTYRRLILLSSGALLLDTPGMREVQLWADEDTVDASFSDIVEAAEGCRFRDCTHHQEPGCNVRESISPERLLNYFHQHDEIAALQKKITVQATEREKLQTEKKKGRAAHKSRKNYRVEDEE